MEFVRKAIIVGTGGIAPLNATPDKEPPAPTQRSATDELYRLSQLNASGALSDDEFAAAKRRLLGT